MKFYFCQGCGCRITEEDISAGEGRDKKLKGVYCKECAVGVTTMATLPVAQRETRKVVEETSAPPASSDPVKRPSRRSSAVGLPTATKGGASHARSTQRLPVASATQSSHASFVVPAILAALVAFGCLMVFSSQTHAPAVKTTASPRPRNRTRKPKVVTRKRIPQNESKPNLAPKRQARMERPERSRSPEPLVSSKPEPVAQTSNEIPPLPNTQQSAKEDTQPTPKKAPPTEAPDNRHDPEAAKAKLVEYLTAFDRAVSQGDLATACKTVEQAKSDVELKGVMEEAAAIGRVGQVLAEAEAARKRALDALTDGEKHSFETTGGTVVGVVRKIEGHTLKVRVEGKTNNQVIEYEKRVKLEDLTPACRAKVLGEKDPETADEWMAEAVRKIAEKDAGHAEQALAKAGAHALAAHYRKRIDALQLAARETAASREWEERVMPLTKTAKFTEKEAKSGQKVLQAFRGTHGKTAFAKSVAQQAQALEESLLAAVGQPKVAYRGLVLHLDFEDALADSWQVSRDRTKAGNHLQLTNPQKVAGVVGRTALGTSGTESYGQRKRPALSLQPNQTQISLAAWARSDSSSGGYHIIAAFGAPAKRKGVWIGRNGSNLRAGAYGNEVLGKSGVWTADNAWHHVVMTYDGTIARLYLDGTEVGSENANWSVQPDLVRIGRQLNDNAEFWSGAIDDVRIYNRLLSPVEIRTIHGLGQTQP